MKNAKTTTAVQQATDGTPKPKRELPGEQQLLALFDRAQAGDKSTLPEVRRVLDLIDGSVTPVALQTRQAIINKMAGTDLLFSEDLTRQCTTLRKKLAGENPTQLELLLAERIVVCWLTVNYYETLYIQTMKDISWQTSDHHQKRLDHANRRYLASMKALAQVRRLQLPAVQLNVAENQINVGSNQITFEKDEIR